MMIRIYTRRRLFLDDAFLVFGLACLCATTVLFYRKVRIMYMIDVAPQYFDIINSADQFQSLLNASKFLYTIHALMWTTIFAVKFSFLILFWHLILRTSKRLKRYYWAVTGTCVISWMYVICGPFMICPYFGADEGEFLFWMIERLNLSCV